MRVMQDFPERTKGAKKSFGVCSISALYVILVTLIPIVGFGDKGSGTNSLLKAVIFIFYFLALLFRSRFKIVLSMRNIYIFLSYLVTQLASIAVADYPVSIINVLIQTASLCNLLFLLPAVTAQRHDIINGIEIFVLFNIVAILYNIAIHFRRFMDLSFLTNVYYDMHSFFDNKNTYGMILFVVFVLLFYWYYLCDGEKEKAKIRVLMCLQFFAIATSLCRAALLCSVIFLFCNYLKKITAKKLLTTFILFFMIAIAFGIPSVREYLLFVLLRIDVGTYRQPIVDASIRIVNENIIFGCGERGWEIMLDRLSGNPYSHNGFLTVLMTGGLVYFIAYLVIIFNALKRAIWIRKVNFNLGSQIIFFLITMVVYAFFESVVLCEANAANFAFTTVALIIPQLICNMLIKGDAKGP